MTRTMINWIEKYIRVTFWPNNLPVYRKREEKKMIKKRGNIYCCYIFTIPLLVIEFLGNFIQVTM